MIKMFSKRHNHIMLCSSYDKMHIHANSFSVHISTYGRSIHMYHGVELCVMDIMLWLITVKIIVCMYYIYRAWTIED